VIDSYDFKKRRSIEIRFEVSIALASTERKSKIENNSSRGFSAFILVRE
jgi:hypothetical protein